MTTSAWHFTGPPGSRIDDLDFVQPREGREQYIHFWNSYFPVVKRRRRRWEKSDPRTRPETLQRFIHKGIPHIFRKEIWMRNVHPRGLPPQMDIPESVVEAIRMDLPRTYPDNEWLKSEKNRNMLGRVLYAVAQYEPQVGYCQGLNFVAALVLLVIRNEEQATDLVVSIVRKRSDRYGTEMIGLKKDALVLEEILKKSCPKVVETLKRIGVGLDLLVCKWFICWFVESIPMETTLRIWDCVLYDGDFWLFKVAVVLIKEHAIQIALCNRFDQLIDVFQNIGNSKTALYCHELIKKAESEPITEKIIEVLRNQVVVA